MRIYRSTLLLVIFAQLHSQSAAHAAPTVGTTSQVSLSVVGGVPSGQSTDASIGANGRQLVFSSMASDLVAGDTNGVGDVFVRDLQSGVTLRASVASGGFEADAASTNGAVSPTLPDGFYAIAIESAAKNLGSLSNPPGNSNIFIRMPTLDITEIVSPDPSADPQSGWSSSRPSITALRNSDGTTELRIVFASDSNTLVANDTNNQRDIFLARFKVPDSSVYTLADQLTIQRISLAAIKTDQSNGSSDTPKISADGRYVLFASQATNLVSGFPGGVTAAQIYRYDITTNTTTLVSKSSAGDPADADCSNPSISFNGRFVAYKTTADNIISNPGPEYYNLFWNDISTGATKRVNESESKESGNGTVADGAISANGRFVTFSDSSSNLVSDDANDTEDVFVKDVDSGKVLLVSVGPGGVQANQFSSMPVIAAPYTSLTLTVAYSSYATNLTNPSTSTTLSDIYENSVVLDPPVLSASTPLEVPPEVTIGSKKLKFTAQKFSASPVTASNRKIQYEFEVRATNRVNGTRRTTRSLLISKRNTVTAIKQRSTTYVVRNRVRAVNSSTGATQFKTSFTPRQKFTTP